MLGGLWQLETVKQERVCSECSGALICCLSFYIFRKGGLTEQGGGEDSKFLGDFVEIGLS